MPGYSAEIYARNGRRNPGAVEPSTTPKALAMSPQFQSLSGTELAVTVMSTTSGVATLETLLKEISQGADPHDQSSPTIPQQETRQRLSLLRTNPEKEAPGLMCNDLGTANASGFFATSNQNYMKLSFANLALNIMKRTASLCLS